MIMIIILIGYLSGVIGLLAVVPYLRGIFKKETKPERASWLIWTIVDVIAFFSQLAKGASNSLFMTGAYALGDISIFLLAFKYGYGSKLLKRDVIALFGVGISLVFWYLTKEAATAIFIIIMTDAIAGILTVIKSYESPTTENMTKWILTVIASLLASIAVGSLNVILIAFPLYIFLESVAIIVAIELGRRHNLRIQKA